jgi:hypothetical protein
MPILIKSAALLAAISAFVACGAINRGQAKTPSCAIVYGVEGLRDLLAVGPQSADLPADLVIVMFVLEEGEELGSAREELGRLLQHKRCSSIEWDADKDLWFLPSGRVVTATILSVGKRILATHNGPLVPHIADILLENGVVVGWSSGHGIDAWVSERNFARALEIIRADPVICNAENAGLVYFYDV